MHEEGLPEQARQASEEPMSEMLRALGLINPVADLDAEANSFGTPPAIGLNSNYKFDFNPDDGIDADKLDFEAIAQHEIGHVLGLVSSVGEQERDGFPSDRGRHRGRTDQAGPGSRCIPEASPIPAVLGLRLFKV